MPDAPTPGQVAHAAFTAALPERRYFPAPGWDTVPPHTQRAWEAAAQAVLEACAMVCPICGAELERCNAEDTP